MPVDRTLCGTGGRASGGAAQKGTEKAQAGDMSFVITLPSGTYGVQAMHDLNDNGELDTGFMGIPKEPWGFSNNAKGRFGPPKWQDLVFTLEGKSDLTIDLNL